MLRLRRSSCGDNYLIGEGVSVGALPGSLNRIMRREWSQVLCNLLEKTFFFLVSSFFLSILISKSSFNVQKTYLYTSTTTVRPLTVPSHTSPLLPLLCHSLPMRGLFQLLGSHILKAKLNFLLGEYFCICSSTPASGKKGNYVGPSFLWVETE